MNAHEDELGMVPEWLLERLAAGELPPKRAAAVRERLAREPGGAERLARLGASDVEILEAHPPAEIVESVRRRAREAERRRAAASAQSRRLFLVGAPVLLAAVTVMVLWARPVEDERPKGLSPVLHVYRKGGQRAERLKDGAPVHAGDQLRLAYVAAGNRFGALLSLDGAGKVTFHLPAGGPGDGAKAVPLGRDGEVLLPEAYELDAAPSFERFLLVAGEAPFDVGPLAAVIRGAAAPPPKTVTATFTVRKE